MNRKQVGILYAYVHINDLFQPRLYVSYSKAFYFCSFQILGEYTAVKTMLYKNKLGFIYNRYFNKMILKIVNWLFQHCFITFSRVSLKTEKRNFVMNITKVLCKSNFVFYILLFNQKLSKIVYKYFFMMLDKISIINTLSSYRVVAFYFLYRFHLIRIY